MTHQMQQISTFSAVSRISQFVDWPSVVVGVNTKAVGTIPFAPDLRLDFFSKLMWDELSGGRFRQVDYIGYADREGSFIGFERLPKRFASREGASQYGGERLGKTQSFVMAQAKS